MKITQFVMAYGAEQDRLRAMLPEGFESLRPVLRINAQLGCSTGYVELNTPVAQGDFRGWLNIASWEDVPFRQQGRSITFQTDFLEITFSPTGVVGGCPAEKDNQGCFFLTPEPVLRLPEVVTAEKEYCDCRFAWQFAPGDAYGQSIGKTLPAFPEAPVCQYPPLPLTAENAAAIPCRQVLGSYMVRFER